MDWDNIGLEVKRIAKVCFDAGKHDVPDCDFDKVFKDACELDKGD